MVCQTTHGLTLPRDGGFMTGPTCVRDSINVPEGDIVSILALPPSGRGLLATSTNGGFDSLKAYRGPLSVAEKCYLNPLDLSPSNTQVPEVIRSELEVTSTMLESATNMWQVLNSTLDRQPRGASSVLYWVIRSCYPQNRVCVYARIHT